MTGETRPDSALPLLGDVTVTYSIYQEGPYQGIGRSGQAWLDVVELPAEEIDELPDPRLRRALWRQYQANVTDSPKQVLVIARQDGSYERSQLVRRTPTELFDEAPDEQAEISEQPQATERPGRRQRIAGFIARLFSEL